MPIQVGITGFRYDTGGGTVNFVDKNGAQFIPEYIIIMNSSSLNNVLYSNGTGNYNTWSWCQNLFRASDGAAGGSMAGENPQFGSLKICTTGNSSGNAGGINSFESDAFFGGDIYRNCQISSVGNGYFTYIVSYDLNFFTTDMIACCIKGISMDYVTMVMGAGTYATPFEAKGVYNPRVSAWSVGAGGTATGAGGLNIGWGWDSPFGGPYSLVSVVQNQDANYRGMSTATYNAGLSVIGVPGGVSVGARVTAWNPSSITVTAANSPYIIGGTNIVTATGSVNLNTSVGYQTFNTGIYTQLLFGDTIGTNLENTVLSDWAENCMGWSDGSRNASLWYGESKIGNGFPMLGACYISDNTLIRAANASGINGGSTTFGTIASIVEFKSDGDVTIYISTADGVPRKFYYMAIGEAATPVTGSGDISGIYYINPTKSTRSDSYYTEDKKIPNPKVRTALLGE